jgi:hypothetical protein
LSICHDLFSLFYFFLSISHVTERMCTPVVRNLTTHAQPFTERWRE